MFGVDEKAVGTLLRNLGTDPFLGEPDETDSLMRRYPFRGYVVTYRISEAAIAQDVVVLWLLRLRPEEKPKANLTGKAQKLLDTYIKVKRAFGGIFGNDE